MPQRRAEPPVIPPTIEILLSEDFPSDPERLRKRFSKSTLIRDLHRQALWSLENYVYYKTRADEFAVVPSASLDPLSRIQPCPHPQCIDASVTNLARTLCIYADVVVLPD